MAISRTVKLEGMEEVLKNLAAYGERARQAAGVAIYEEARAIEQASVTKYVPVDQQKLRDEMAFIDEEAQVNGDVLSVEFGYRGPYAASVHENPRSGKTGGVSPKGRKYAHWATVGQWKFLETPLLEAEAGMLKRIADRMRDVLGGKLASTFYGED